MKAKNCNIREKVYSGSTHDHLNQYRMCFVDGGTDLWINSCRRAGACAYVHRNC